jgi:BirA family biotin operon repressor/biotin-[acetyl-CoA-carboxylase] ligase
MINRMLLSETPKEAELFERYKKRLCMLGVDVAVAQDEEPYKAKALDIDEKGRLLVRTADGEIRTLSSGEIAIL